MDAVAGLEQQHIAGLCRALQCRHQLLPVRKGSSPGLRHTAGDGSTDNAPGIGAVGKDIVCLFRGKSAHPVMLRLGAVTQLQHIPQHRDPPSLLLPQDSQRRRHGLGACVVAVLDDGHAAGLDDLLTAGNIPELGKTRLNLFGQHPQLQADLNLRNTFTGLILPSVTSVFYIYLLKETFSQVPDELYYAAKVDGTSDLKYLFKVMIPICRPTVVTITILKVIECWNSYVWPRLITDDQSYFLVSNGIQEIRENGFGRENIPAMMAAVVAISLPLIVLFLIFRKKIMEGVSRGGVKG